MAAAKRIAPCYDCDPCPDSSPPASSPPFSRAFFAFAPAPSHAQAWPTRQPIRVIVPLTPGSAIDIVARLVFEQVGRQIGQTVVIENRPGASQTLGAGAVAKAEPDGYTLLVAGSALAVVPSTMANLAFDVERELTAVASLANVPLVLVVNPGKGYTTIHEFVAAAKPGTFTYGSGGRGDSTHLAAERFRLAAGFTGLYVPFRGSPEVLNEVMAGRLDFYMAPAAPALLDVATTTELGFANSDYEFWVGAFAPVRDAARARRSTQWRNRQGAGHAGRARSSQEHRRICDADLCAGVRRAVQAGDRRECGVGEGGRAAGELM